MCKRVNVGASVIGGMVHSWLSLRSVSSLILCPHIEKVGASRLSYRGWDSNPLWADLSLTMAFVNDLKRGRISVGLRVLDLFCNEQASD